MITVKRANVVLDVLDEQKDEYLAKGFNVINDSGEVIESSVPNDVNSLTVAYSQHVEKIESLEKELAKAKSEIATLKRKPKTTKKSE